MSTSIICRAFSVIINFSPSLVVPYFPVPSPHPSSPATTCSSSRHPASPVRSVSVRCLLVATRQDFRARQGSSRRLRGRGSRYHQCYPTFATHTSGAAEIRRRHPRSHRRWLGWSTCGRVGCMGAQAAAVHAHDEPASRCLLDKRPKKRRTRASAFSPPPSQPRVNDVSRALPCPLASPGLPEPMAGGEPSKGPSSSRAPSVIQKFCREQGTKEEER